MGNIKTMSNSCQLTARDAVKLLRQGKVSPDELISEALGRIAKIDGRLNALPTICEERARAAAREAGPDSLLGGLPIAIKDLMDVAGVRTTYGSTIFADHRPERSDISVERLEANGAVVLAKSNTPEFGAGANTFNEVFGKTLNPWDMRMTSGGSSGGSAAALASGQVWLASGSDLGGSLRIPAGFCSVVGLRPSPGRVARSAEVPFNALPVVGPMGRNVGDVALMLDAMTGADARDPLALEAPSRSFLSAVENPKPPARMGFSPDLGIVPVVPEVAEICAAAAARFAELGCTVEEACPDFSGAPEIFQTLRASGYAAGVGRLLGEHRDQLKPEVVWNIEKGMKLSAGEIGLAEVARGALIRRMGEFFGDFDLLACPVTQVPPFDVDMRYMDEINGQKMETYIDWFAITFVLTLTGCPAISLPCGFTADGLPVGLQLIGRPRAEAALLSAAAAAEEMLGIAALSPIDPREAGRHD